MNEYFISGNTVKTLANNARRIAQTEDELNVAEIAEIFSRTQGSYSNEIVGVDEESNEDSSVYLIQEDTMDVIANHVRRVCNTADNLNAEEIADASSHIQGTVKDTGEYKVEAANLAGEALKSGLYDSEEIFAFPTLSNMEKRIVALITQPDGSSAYTTIAEFDGWSATAPIIRNSFINIDDSPVDSGILMKPVNDDLIIIVNITEANTTITLQIYNPGVINWGDGVTDTYESRTYQQSHTYSNVGKYLITIPYKQYCHINNSIRYDSLTGSLIELVFIPKWCTPNTGLVSACSGLTGLQGVGLANGVFLNGNTAISGTFERCTSLEYVILPSSATKLQDRLFADSGIKGVVLPYGVTEIPSGCFNGCSNLTSLIIPTTVTIIGHNCFSNCSSLKDITIPNGVTTIGSYAFSNCSELSSIALPNTIISIDNSCFADCYSLESVVLPESITEIGSYMFKGCYNLKDITIPNGVTTIGSHAFSNCSSSDYVFNEKIKQLNLPSVTTIGEFAFYGLANLKSIVLSANTVCTRTSYAIFSVTPNVYVPDNLVDAYKSDANWSDCASKIKPISEYVPE